jgi:cytochrome c biogenesis factor
VTNGNPLDRRARQADSAAMAPSSAARVPLRIIFSVATALVVPFAMGRFSALAGFGIWLATWIVAAAATTLVDRVKNTGGSASIANRLRGTPRAWYGMLLAHIGVAVFVVGVTMVKTYEAEKDVRMAAGDTVELGGHVFAGENRAGQAGFTVRHRRHPIEQVCGVTGAGLNRRLTLLKSRAGMTE